jgi:glucarate dehydratase
VNRCPFQGGRIGFVEGAVRVPNAPGLGVTIDRDALERLHEQYLACGIRQRDDLAQMRKYDPAFTGRTPRFRGSASAARSWAPA